MILLAFLSCFLVFFVKDPFFLIKGNCCVFELSVLCVYLFHCTIAPSLNYSRFRVLHAVDSLIVKYES